MGNIIWNEASIREEISRLDEKTELNGADLRITFNNSTRKIGSYSPLYGCFTFSKHFFSNPKWPVEEALDTIRHEYAHYMDHMLYGPKKSRQGHGITWKYCCRCVGAIPVRCNSGIRTNYYQEKHTQESELSERLDEYRIGDCIKHPLFGVGTIEAITGESVNRRITVNFPDVGKKELTLEWVEKNCKKQAA